MSTETIQFLQALRRGADPDALFQDAFKHREQALDERLHATTRELLARQATVEAQVQPIVARVAALDVVSPGQQEAEGCQRHIDDMRTAQTQLQSTLGGKKGELQEQQHKVASLNNELMHLRGLLGQLEDPNEAFIIKVGRQAVKKIGGKNE